ncbi:MAG: hypothetical protein OEL89_05310 [Candidatus Peregrinibacteria bacterium]|nr:hypothetical protein [Candidatus Peregrinibacteria bacterium]
MNFIRKLFFKSDEGGVPDEKQELKKMVLFKISQLEKSKVLGKNVDELLFIFRVFIKNMFDIREQLTLEEMLKRLKARKLQKVVMDKITLFSVKISEAKYSNIKIEQTEFDELVLDFKKIVELV